MLRVVSVLLSLSLKTLGPVGVGGRSNERVPEVIWGVALCHTLWLHHCALAEEVCILAGDRQQILPLLYTPIEGAFYWQSLTGSNLSSM